MDMERPEVEEIMQITSGTQPTALSRYVRQDGSLVLAPFKEDELRPEVHSGSYKCCLANRFGSLCSRPVRLRAVVDSATRNLEVFDELVPAGNVAIIKCKPPNTSVSRYLEQFVWFKNDKLLLTEQSAFSSSDNLDSYSPLKSIRKLRQQQQLPDSMMQIITTTNPSAQKFLLLPDGSLLIRNVTKFDSANYKCRAKHKLNQLQWSSRVAGQLVVIDDYNSSSRSNNELRQLSSSPLNWARELERNYLLCAQFQSLPVASFTWFKLQPPSTGDPNKPNKVPLFGAQPNDQLFSDNIIQLDSCLLFQQLQTRHAGTYLCEASNGNNNGGPAISSTKRLVVSSAQLTAQINYHQTRGELMKSIGGSQQSSSTVVIAFGSSVQLNCSISGHPYDTIAWFKDSQLLAVSSGQAFGYLQLEAQNSTAISMWKSSSLATSAPNLKLVQPTVITIDGFQLKNRGVYQCQVYSSGSDFKSYLNKLIASTLSSLKSSPNSPVDSDQSLVRSIQAELESWAERDFARSASGSIHLDIAMSKPSLINGQKSSSSPATMMIQKHSPLTLQCASIGLPLPKITWFLDSQLIANSADNYIEAESYSSTDFQNLDSMLNSSISLLADERFQVSQVQELAANYGGQPVVISQLNISQIETSETGEYKCVASNYLGFSEQAFQVNVIQQHGNTNNNNVQLRSYQSLNVTLVAGKSTKLQCPLIGYPLSRVDWFHNGQRLPANHRQHIESIKSGAGGQLELTNIDKSTDGGLYTCRVSLNSTSNDNSDSEPATISDDMIAGQLQAIVRTAPLIDTQSLPEIIQANEGMRTKLVCSLAQGDHPIDVKWLRRTSDRNKFASVGKSLWYGYELVQNSMQADKKSSGNDEVDAIAVLNLEDSCLLTFKQISYADSGDYLCVAHNDVGQTTRRTRVVVNVAPAWSQLEPPSDVSVQLGNKLQLDCSTHGHPTPVVQWKKALKKPTEQIVTPTAGNEMEQSATRIADFVDLQNNYRHRVFSNGSLVIEQIDEQDAGVYMCEVTNGIGVGLSKVTRVQVNIPPYFKQRASTQLAQANAKVELKCLVYGDQPMIVGWRKGFEDIVDLVKDVRHRIVSEHQLSPQAFESILAIENLTRTDSGQYGCIASNEFGTEETRVQLIVQEPPEVPIIMRPIRATSRQATISFKLPYSGNSPIRKYAIYYKQMPTTLFPGNDLEENSQDNKDISLNNWQQVLVDAPIIAPDDQPPMMSMNMNETMSMDSSIMSHHQLVNLNLCCLKPFARYSIKVRAINELGQSEPSKLVQFITDEEAIGGPPLDVGVEATGAHSIKVRWRAPAANLQNGRIKGYYIGYKANIPSGVNLNGPKPITNSVSQSASNLVRVFEGGFSEGEQYQYKNVQLGAGSIISPTGTRMSMLLDETLAGDWMSTDMMQNASAFGTQQQQQQQQPQVYTSYLTNLRRKTSYSIIVQAYNKIGSGPRSDQIVVSTLDAAPPMSPILRLISVTFDSAQLIKSGRKFGSDNGTSALRSNEKQLLAAYTPHESEFDQTFDEDDDPQSYFTINYKVEEARQHNLMNNNAQQSQPTQQQSDSNNNGNTDNGWLQKRINKRQPQPYLLQNLRCGSYYLAYMTATNSLGQSEPGDTIRFNTMGAAPIAPKDSRDFLTVNSTYSVLHLDSWQNAGCLISSFIIKYRASSQVKWTILEHQVLPTIQTVTISGSPVFSTRPLVNGHNSDLPAAMESSSSPRISSQLPGTNQRVLSNRQQSLSDFIIRNLLPGSSFKLVVEANSEAGSTVAEYEFETSNFSSSTVAINVHGIIASEITDSNRGLRQRESDFGEPDSSYSFSNQRPGSMNQLRVYSNMFNVWSLTIVFVVASIFMAVATLVLGLRSIIRMKPRAGSGGSRDNLISALLCCSSSSSSSSSSGNDSSHSSSGGTCYQLADSHQLNGGPTNEMMSAYCSLPGPGSLILSSSHSPLKGAMNQRSLSSRFGFNDHEHLEDETCEGGELKSIAGGDHCLPFRSQMVSSSSLSTIGGHPFGRSLGGSSNNRHAQTLSRFGNTNNNPDLSVPEQQPMIGAHLRAHYAATLGKQPFSNHQSSFNGTSPMGPLKYNATQSPVYARTHQHQQIPYLSLQTGYQSSFQQSQQLASDAGMSSGYETNTNAGSKTTNESDMDEHNRTQSSAYNLDRYRVMSGVYDGANGNNNANNNLFNSTNNNQLYGTQDSITNHGHQVVEQSQGQCYYVAGTNNNNNQNQNNGFGSQQQQPLPHDAYGLLFGSGTAQALGLDKSLSANQQQELNHQLNSLLANHLQQTPN